MGERRRELVRIDSTGTVHPVGKVASQRLRARQGAFRLMPAPGHLVVMRYVGEDGQRDAEDGPVFRLAGEITAPGALCDIVSLVGQAGWKGELVVLDGSTSRSIFFDHGHVVAAQSSAEEERIGAVLYRYGILAEEQVEQTVQATTSDCRFGETAVRLGLITRERLFYAVAAQIQEIVYAVLTVGDGMFYFLETYDEERLTSRLSLSVANLLMEGVRRMDETKYFRERVPSELHVPARVSGRPPPNDPELSPVWEAIDGQRSVADVGRIVGQGEFEATRAVFQLVQAGVVTVHAPRPTGPEAMATRFNEAIALLLGEAAIVGQDEELRAQLASFASGGGIYDALFRGAGPGPNGAVDAERVVQNVRTMVGDDAAETMLAQWLYEYASFAMFAAEPLLRQGPALSAPASSSAPVSRRASVLRRASDLLSPLAPA